MTPSQVRAELLGEHFELRRLIEEARSLLRSGKETLRIELCDAVDCLATALHSHSAHEETAVRLILEALRDRARPGAVMDAQHVAEHARLVAVLRAAASDSKGPALLDRVGALLDELESHMTYEEGVLLSEDLLGDDAGGAPPS